MKLGLYAALFGLATTQIGAVKLDEINNNNSNAKVEGQVTINMNNSNSDAPKQDQQLLAQVGSQQMPDLHSNVTIIDASRTLYGPGGVLEKLAQTKAQQISPPQNNFSPTANMYGSGFMRGSSMINQGKINGLIGLGQFFGGTFAQTGSEEQQYIEDIDSLV